MVTESICLTPKPLGISLPYFKSWKTDVERRFFIFGLSSPDYYCDTCPILSNLVLFYDSRKKIVSDGLTFHIKCIILTRKTRMLTWIFILENWDGLADCVWKLLLQRIQKVKKRAVGAKSHASRILEATGLAMTTWMCIQRKSASHASTIWSGLSRRKIQRTFVSTTGRWHYISDVNWPLPPTLPGTRQQVNHTRVLCIDTERCGLKVKYIVNIGTGIWSRE